MYFSLSARLLVSPPMKIFFCADENGTNRVSCSRLYETATALEVPIGFFFMDSTNAGIELAVAEQFDVPDLKDGIHLMTAFHQIPSVAIRKSFIAFVETLAGELNGGRR